MPNSSKKIILALLGPTNTGKTHDTIEKMLEFKTGIFGLPLRLLAREVYEKCVKKIGINKVALITGEEKIIPNSADYFICTVESMPKDKFVDFVAVDEIQMCADKERGHIFTDRLLHFRGEKLTMFLGSQVMKSIIKNLVDNVQFIKKERFSKLSYSGTKLSYSFTYFKTNFRLDFLLWSNSTRKSNISAPKYIFNILIFF